MAQEICSSVNLDFRIVLVLLWGTQRREILNLAFRPVFRQKVTRLWLSLASPAIDCGAP